MGLEEGLGKCVGGLRFVIKEVSLDSITTDLTGDPCPKDSYAPFDYKVGQQFSTDIYEKGGFIICEDTGETYFKSEEGEYKRIEGNLNDFINKIQAEGKKNKFNRLLSEGKIIAQIRTNAYMGNDALLEVALAEDKDWFFNVPVHRTCLEAYSVLVNLKDKTGKIVEADYSGGQQSFYEKNNFKDASIVKLPEDIIETAQPYLKTTQLNGIIEAIEFKPINHELMVFIRENCFRPGSKH